MGKKNKMEFIDEWREYEHKLTQEEKNYVRRFYNEYYGAHLYGDDRLLDDDARKEAHRNKNSDVRDALSFTKKYDMLDDIADVNEQDFLDSASKKWEWQNVYKVLGYNAAFDKILEQSIKDLQNSELDTKIVLVRFYSQVCELDRLNRRRKKHK